MLWPRGRGSQGVAEFGQIPRNTLSGLKNL